MIPCCCHFMIPSGDGKTVDIVGCSNGIDFDVIHESGVFREDGELVEKPQLSGDAAQAVDDYLFIQYARTRLSTERALEARISP